MYAKLSPPIKKILLATRQPGTVCAFQPLLKQFIKEGWDYTIIASESSIDAWKIFQETILIEGQGNINFSEFDLVLTGTSLNVGADAMYWSKAKEHHIPSVAFVESWVNYAERFTHSSHLDSLPSKVFVIDKLAAKRMMESGVSSNLVEIVGHPRFDSLMTQYRDYQKDANKIDKKIVFFTDPVNLKDKDVKGASGYTSQEIVTKILHQYSKLDLKHKVNLILKPHPREKIQIYQRLINGLNLTHQVNLSTNSATDLILSADVVLGMNSILLVDSAILEKPTYSFQFNRTVKNNDITDRVGIKVVIEEEELEGIFEEIKKRIEYPSRETKPYKTYYHNEIFEKLSKLVFA